MTIMDAPTKFEVNVNSGLLRNVRVLHHESQARNQEKSAEHDHEWGVPYTTRQRVIKFSSLFLTNQGPFNLCNQNFYSAIIIVSHIDNTRITGHN